LDLLHDTYHGEFWGKEYVAGSRRGLGGRGRGRGGGGDLEEEGGGKWRRGGAGGKEGRGEERGEKIAVSKVLTGPEEREQQQQQQQQQLDLLKKE